MTPWTPILHFSGKFRFHMPEYNNGPAGRGVAFDAQLPAAEVASICGCDPAKYFEFSLFDVEVRQVTYSDGTSAQSGDPVIGMPLTLEGYMVDVSPTAICAQIFAHRFRLGDLVQGVLSKAVQSDLRLSIRPAGFGDESAAAHFESVLTAASPLPLLPNSRARIELGNVQVFDLHLHLNRYTRLDNADEPDNQLTGDAYGYLRPFSPKTTSEGARVRDIRLVAHPDLSSDPDIESIYLATPDPGPLRRNSDIDGYYDIDRGKNLIGVRYLDFVPFLDRNRSTALMSGYAISWESRGARTHLGTFLGDWAEMKQSGGVVVYSIPEALPEGKLAVDAIRLDGTSARLMIETEWDLLLESDRGVYVASGESAPVSARVYRNNRPAIGQAVTLLTQPANRRSPVVARFNTAEAVSGEDGLVNLKIIALDLGATGGVNDPVTGTVLHSIPFDRFCGNFVYLRVPNPLRRAVPAVEEIEIAVRVLHKVEESTVAAPSFVNQIKPLFSMYVRYFPWLHVSRQGDTYTRFLDVNDPEQFRALAFDIIERLGRSEFDSGRMPRSRDFPVGGRELIQKWIDSGMLD